MTTFDMLDRLRELASPSAGGCGPERPPEPPRGMRLPNGEVPGMWDIICGCQLCRRIRGLPERETAPDAPCPECGANGSCDCEPRF